MSPSIHAFVTRVSVVILLAASVANAQTANQAQTRPSSEAALQQRVAALEKEVRWLKSELAALRAQLSARGTPHNPVSGGGSASPVGRPSQQDIEAAGNSTEGCGYNGPVNDIQYGVPFSEPPNGTTVYPVKLRFQGNHFYTSADVYVDPFGKWKCRPRHD